MSKSFELCLILAFLLVTTHGLHAQQGAESERIVQIIPELVALLDHEDPATANAALDSLKSFCSSRDNKIRFRAQTALEEFHEEAWKWLKDNARFSYPFRKETVQVRGRTSYFPNPTPWHQRHQERFSIDFVDADIDPAKLVYLRVVGLEALAFVQHCCSTKPQRRTNSKHSLLIGNACSKPLPCPNKIEF